MPQTFDAGYVVGAVLGDGSLSVAQQKSGRSYYVRLSATDKAFVERFREHFRATRGGPVWMCSFRSTKKANPAIGMPECEVLEWITGATDRGWYEKLKSLEIDRDFTPIRQASRDFKEGFAQGFLDAEGYVNQTAGYTDLANKDLELLNTAAAVYRELGYQARVYGPYPYARDVAHLRVAGCLPKTETRE